MQALQSAAGCVRLRPQRFQTSERPLRPLSRQQIAADVCRSFERVLPRIRLCGSNGRRRIHSHSPRSQSGSGRRNGATCRNHHRRRRKTRLRRGAGFGEHWPGFLPGGWHERRASAGGSRPAHVRGEDLPLRQRRAARCGAIGASDQLSALGPGPPRSAAVIFLHTFWCRIYLKKTLVLAQNLENKGPEILLPPRSMVLKVVRGKILETLELCWASRVRHSEAAPVRQVVKDR